MAFEVGEVWFAEFPYEEEPSITTNRPVVVLDADTYGVLSVKITKHAQRENDKYDTPIIEWSKAGLKLASTARISKTIILSEDAFIFKIGKLVDSDLSDIMDKYVEYMKNK